MVSMIWCLTRITGFREFMAPWGIMRDLGPARLAYAFLGELEQVHAVQQGLAPLDAARAQDQAQQRLHGGGFARARFSHQAQALASVAG